MAWRLMAASLLTAALTASSAFAAASAIRYDGTLPIYPRAVIRGEAGVPADKFAKALPIGFQMLGDTTDSPATVARWYRAHLPASFTMQSGPGGSAAFHHGQSVIGVRIYQGKTLIVLSP